MQRAAISSGVGFLALFGVSVQTGVIMVEYINQLRARGMPVRAVAIEGATRRLRPIMLTMLVATLGLLPAVWWARPNDHLPTPEESKSVYEH